MKKFMILIPLCSILLILSSCQFIPKSSVIQLLDEENTALRYPYAQLNDSEKSLYSALYYGIENMSETIDLPQGYSGDEYEKVFTLLYRQEPQFFFLDTQYSVSERMTDAIMYYQVNYDEMLEMKSELDAVIEDVLFEISSLDSEYDKVLFIHDYIVENCEYSESATENSNSIYGCLIEKSAQCEGYAKTFLYLCRLSGINAMSIVGITDDNVNHEWNIVQIDGKFYNVDVTWDDPYNSPDAVEDNIWRFYLNLRDDEMIGITHFPQDNNFIAPECNSSDANYYYRNNLIASNLDEAKSILEREIGRAASNSSYYADIKMDSKSSYEEVKQSIFTNQEIFNILKEQQRMHPNAFDPNKYILHEKESLLCISVQLTG